MQIDPGYDSIRHNPALRISDVVLRLGLRREDLRLAATLLLAGLLFFFFARGQLGFGFGAFLLGLAHATVAHSLVLAGVPPHG